jgi:hypothetical protein
MFKRARDQSECFSPLTLLFVLGRAADPIETQRASVKHPSDSGRLGAPMGQMSHSCAVRYAEQSQDLDLCGLSGIGGIRGAAGTERPGNTRHIG